MAGRRCRNEGTLFRAHNDGRGMILYCKRKAEKAKRLQISPTASVRPFVTENREFSLVWCLERKSGGKIFVPTLSLSVAIRSGAWRWRTQGGRGWAGGSLTS